VEDACKRYYQTKVKSCIYEHGWILGEANETVASGPLSSEMPWAPM